MDGIETLKTIEAKLGIAEAILLTGHESIDTAVEGMICSAFDYLLKPAEFEELLAKLQAARECKWDREQRIRPSEADLKRAMDKYTKWLTGNLNLQMLTGMLTRRSKLKKVDYRRSRE